MKNIRNRHKITDSHILALIQECLTQTVEMGFTVPSKLRFVECHAVKRAGLACHKDVLIVLSTFLYKESDTSIKSTIYHEIGHIIAGPYAKHGPVWKKIVNKMSAVTGIKITRCYSDADMPVHAQARLAASKYNFHCAKCGLQLHYTKRTNFVKTYNDKTPWGSPRWTCSHCGGTFVLDN